ncbi:hypothetical protein PoB_000033100 [Plakobranchus ocellatus]|uniref:Uncharacterized protein n=1 Tax=Plakobranchus ocellatus TaxID=259542 RepID=A0AAV3XUX7_9GAST|nr:hypothetical protein PoB_000033100 [Plakobranchus ocellatus]
MDTTVISRLMRNAFPGLTAQGLDTAFGAEVFYTCSAGTIGTTDVQYKYTRLHRHKLSLSRGYKSWESTSGGPRGQCHVHIVHCFWLTTVYHCT